MTPAMGGMPPTEQDAGAIGDVGRRLRPATVPTR